jgi:hypothetical protein
MMKVFLSYALSDADIARALAISLTQHGMDVFDDSVSVLPGDNWADVVAEALRESEAMVVLVSDASLQSKSVHQNISYAIVNEQYKGRLIPVLVGPSDLSAHPDYPWVLHHLNYVRLVDPADYPVAFKRIVQIISDAGALVGSAA